MGESSFLSQFLMITDLKTVIFIAVLIGTFFIVKQFEKKKVKFSTRTIYATIIGLILGVIIQLVAGLPEIQQKLLGYKKLLNGMDYLVQDLWIY